MIKYRKYSQETNKYVGKIEMCEVRVAMGRMCSQEVVQYSHEWKQSKKKWIDSTHSI
jgi:hypothetical protein